MRLSSHLRTVCILAAAVLAVAAFGAECGAGLDRSRETPVVLAVRETAPAVVNIRTVTIVERRESPFAPFSRDEFFRRFFEDFFDPRLERRRTTSSLGSGVIIDGVRGFILTNHHVVAGASAIKVMPASGEEYEASVVGTDPESDLAVLRIEAGRELPAVRMGRSDDLMIGETVIAIGNPFGLSHTVTTGVISAVKRSFRADKREFHDFIQIDASINPGNSGGPLLNINGELIGINTAIYSKAEGIGFAIPIGRAQRIVDQLIRHGEVQVPWVGLEVQDLTPELSAHFAVQEGRGVLVSRIATQSPAARSGLLRGDVITAINGEAVTSLRDYDRVLAEVSVDAQIVVDFLRQGKVRNVRMIAESFPAALAEEWFTEITGLTLEQRRDTAGLEVTGVRRDSAAASLGLRSGDVVRSINDQTLRTKEDLRKAVLKYRRKGPATILVQRGPYGYYLTMEF